MQRNNEEHETLVSAIIFGEELTTHRAILCEFVLSGPYLFVDPCITDLRCCLSVTNATIFGFFIRRPRHEHRIFQVVFPRGSLARSLLLKRDLLTLLRRGRVPLLHWIRLLWTTMPLRRRLLLLLLLRGHGPLLPSLVHGRLLLWSL